MVLALLYLPYDIFLTPLLEVKETVGRPDFD